MNKLKFQKTTEELRFISEKAVSGIKEKLPAREVLNLIFHSHLSLLEKLIFLIPSRIVFFKKREDLIFHYRIKKFYEGLKKENLCLNKDLPFFKGKINEEDVLNILILFYQIFFQDQYLVKETIKKNDIVIDAGANLGIFSLFAAYQGAKIFAFEPVLKTYERLLENIKYFEAQKDIFPFRFALGESSKESLIKVASPSSASRMTDSFPFPKINFIGKEMVRVIPLDIFLRDFNFNKKIDCLKIDTEGYELKVLKGAEKTIKKFKPKILISAYHKKNDKREIPYFILKIRPDYRYKLIKRGEEIFIFY
ncbi:MAG: FkbM family methyltransferase [Minisyncoccales bacterium]